MTIAQQKIIDDATATIVRITENVKNLQRENATFKELIQGFPITPEMSLKRHGAHNDTAFEISNHNRKKMVFVGPTHEWEPGPGTWCYYVFIHEDALSAKDFEEFWLLPTMHERSGGRRSELTYNYYSARFSEANWHGGVTWYEKLDGIDGGARRVKIGCDFAHAWDENCSYSFEGVEREAIATIEALHGMYNFNRRCVYTGAWRPIEQMIEVDGRLYTHEARSMIDESKMKVVK